MESDGVEVDNVKIASFNASVNDGMDQLIPIINKMQDVCLQMGKTLQFDLPQIAVIGSQSAGKSSVLENIVGRDFLPRGKGIVTRRPLILQLRNDPREYGEFEHSKEKREYTDFSEIRAEIVAETKRNPGKGKAISKDPIRLRIHSPNVLDLTLIDLPGLTKVAIDDQPADIERQVKEMIIEYVAKENCLILAVSPANNDLANSDALKLAKEVDPEGLRTISVITKVDLMDHGTDAREIFDGTFLPLHHGYIGVVNRSQQEVETKKDIESALQREREFFENHKSYRHIANRLGTQYLMKVLNQQLTEHIRNTLPGLQDKTRKRMVRHEKELADFEKEYPTDSPVKRGVMLDIILQLQLDFEKEIGASGSRVISTGRLSSGAKIKRIFHQRFPDEVSKIQHENDTLRRKIAEAIENLNGIDVGFYPPFKAFEALVIEEIDKLEEPIIICIDLVVEELSKAVRYCTQQITKYTKFRQYIEDDIMSYIHRNSLVHQKDILSLIRMETAYMNTMHDEFIREPFQANGSELGRPQNGTIREGYLHIGKGDEEMRTHWCTLTSTSLSAYKGNRVLAISLNDLDIRDAIRDGAPNEPSFILFRPSGRDVCRNTKELELSRRKSPEALQQWKESILQAIDGHRKEANVDKPDNHVDIDEHPSDAVGLRPQMDDIEDIYQKIGSYLRIVKKTMCDMVPKAITLFIIRKLQQFILKDLLSESISKHLEDGDDNHLMEMIGPNVEDRERNEAMKKTYESCKKALEVIRI